MKSKSLCGFSVGSFEMLKTLYALGIRKFEIKLKRMAGSSMPFFFYQDRKFEICHNNLEKIVFMFPDAEFNFHATISGSLATEVESGLNMAALDHHDILLSRLKMFEEIYRKYGLGRIITIHPPLIFRKGKFVIDEAEAIRNTNLFFRKADAIRQNEGYLTKICIENLMSPKNFAAALGYKVDHFSKMFEGTATFNKTFDSGHANLNEGFPVEEFLNTGAECLNMHIHGNAGILDLDSNDDDQHLPGHKGNVKSWDLILDHVRRKKPTVMFELGRLQDFTAEDFLRMIKDFERAVETPS